MELENYNSFPQNIPLIIEDELFVYPFMIAPIFLSDEQNITSSNVAIQNSDLIMIATNKPGFEGQRDAESFYDCGTVGSVMRKVSLPDGRIKLLFQGLARARITNITDENPLKADVELVKSLPYSEAKVNATMSILKEQIRALSSINSNYPQDLIRTMDENHDPNRVIDLVTSTLRLKKDQIYSIFKEEDVQTRLLELLDYLNSEIEALKLQREIKSRVNEKIEKVNKEYFLKEQLKQIQKELGTDNQRDEEIEEYRAKLEKLKPSMPEDGYVETKKQIDRLSRMHPDSGDAQIIQNYVEWVLEIPFGKTSKKQLKVTDVQKQLEKDHYSLEKPKDRIVEYFAVKELISLRGKKSKQDRGTILCFVGPPGVGKTSLANSISKALKRSLIRIALGGLEDVNELRGHRRTYIGAMPGRITQGLIDAKQMDPIMVLDEIDKVGRSFRGDPAAALLEVLDPEQNEKFRDHYLNFNIDLSSVVFVATANDIGTIPPPLRDRMEFIFVSSYTPQEKFEIAKRYLIPQELKNHGLTTRDIKINDSAIKDMIDKFTREAGVRNLRRKIAQVCRKAAREILEERANKKLSITSRNIKDYMDKEIFTPDEADKDSVVGVVNGLAWTAVGGDVLKIEAIKLKGKGALQLTGSLGEVMKESGRIALSVIKLLIDEDKLDVDTKKIPLTPKEESEKAELKKSDAYHRFDIHLHVPEGATPKDGPSAGITMATAIASVYTDTKVRSDVAMTGELTLSGKVLPIGGLKEKLIAAHRAKIKVALIPQKNYDRDLKEVPKEVLDSIEIIPVKKLEDVLQKALTK
ncbi:MAG: endopeptidase La [Campylobacterales bacterium]